MGLSEWAVHPGLDNAELLAIELDSLHVRQADFEFLMSQDAQDIVREEGTYFWITGLCRQSGEERDLIPELKASQSAYAPERLSPGLSEVVQQYRYL